MSKTTIPTGGITADAINGTLIADDAISEEHLDATAITGSTELAATPADTDEILISDAGTLKRIDFSHIKSVAGTNSFSAYLTANQAIANDTYVKVAFNAEFHDPSSVYDHSSNYRFTVPSGGAGRYHFNTYVRMQGFNEEFRIVPYKNNAQQGYYNTKFSTTGQSFSYGIAFDLQLSDSDYIEIYCWHNGGTKSAQGDTSTPLLTTFSGFRVS